MSQIQRMRLQHLQLLVSLTQNGNLSDTARQLHTTQPGLSRWLKELEEQVGTQLFERYARGVRPTKAGQLLTDHAIKILTKIRRAEDDLAALQQGSLRVLTLGTSPATAPSLVPDAVIAFLKLYPQAKIEIQENTMDTQLERLEQGRLDIALGRLDNYKPQAGIQVETLYREPLRVVARPGHPLAGQTNLCWEDLYAYEWIVWPDGTPIRSKLDIALTLAGKPPPVYRVQSSSQLANLRLLQNSDLLALGSAQVARHFADRGLVVPLNFTIESDAGAVGMCWRDDSKTDQLLLQLLNCFRAIAAQNTNL